VDALRDFLISSGLLSHRLFYWGEAPCYDVLCDGRRSKIFTLLPHRQVPNICLLSALSRQSFFFPRPLGSLFGACYHPRTSPSPRAKPPFYTMHVETSPQPRKFPEWSCSPTRRTFPPSGHHALDRVCVRPPGEGLRHFSSSDVFVQRALFCPCSSSIQFHVRPDCTVRLIIA